MTELRDGRLRKALEHAPDEAGAAPEAVRAAIHAHAAAQLRPALRPELPSPATQPTTRPNRFWRWLLGGPGRGGVPWNGALATVLLAGVVTLVLRYEQTEAPQEMTSSLPTPKLPALAPAPTPDSVPEPEPAARVASPVAPVARAPAVAQALPPPGAEAMASRKAQTAAQAPAAAMADAARDATPAPQVLAETPAAAPKRLPPAAQPAAPQEAERATRRAEGAVTATPVPAPAPPPPPAAAAVAAKPAPTPGFAPEPPAAPPAALAGVAQPYSAVPAASSLAYGSAAQSAAAAVAPPSSRVAVVGQRARMDTQANRLYEAQPPLLLPPDWQTLNLRHGGQARSFTRSQAGAVADLLARLPLRRLTALSPPGGGQDYVLVLHQADGRLLATLTLTGTALQGTVALEGDALQLVGAADAAQAARLRTLLETLEPSFTPR